MNTFCNSKLQKHRNNIYKICKAIIYLYPAPLTYDLHNLQGQFMGIPKETNISVFLVAIFPKFLVLNTRCFRNRYTLSFLWYLEKGFVSYSYNWNKVFKSRLSTFFKGCLPQNLRSPLLNTLSQLFCSFKGNKSQKNISFRLFATLNISATRNRRFFL